MADIVRAQGQNFPLATQFTHRDMGDGTHALVYAPGPAPANAGVNIGDVVLQVPATWDSFRIDVATLGNNEILAAVAAQRIYVVGLTLSAYGNVNVTIAGAAILPARTGAMPFGVGNQMVWPIAARGWYCRAAVGEALQLTLSAAVRVAGMITYYTAT